MLRVSVFGMPATPCPAISPSSAASTADRSDSGVLEPSSTARTDGGVGLRAAVGATLGHYHDVGRMSDEIWLLEFPSTSLRHSHVIQTSAGWLDIQSFGILYVTVQSIIEAEQ